MSEVSQDFNWPTVQHYALFEAYTSNLGFTNTVDLMQCEETEVNKGI